MYWWNWKKLWILSFAVLILTACPGQLSFTLSVPQAKQGESVKANLVGMDGRKASVTVAGFDASIASSTKDSITFNIPSDAPEGEQEVVITSEGKEAKGKITVLPRELTLSFNPNQASADDKVTATLSTLDIPAISEGSLEITVGGQKATVVSFIEDKVVFIVPEVSEGNQEVLLQHGSLQFRGVLRILPPPSFTLSPTQAAPGDDITATLSNYSGVGATVTVGSKAASVKSATSSKVVFTVPDVPKGNQEVIIKSGNKQANNTLLIIIPDVVLTLDRDIAERGETVNADIAGASLEGATLKVGGIDTLFTPTDQDSFSFAVPNDSPAGPQKVIFETTKGNAERSLDIFGDIEEGKLTIILKPETNETEFQTQIGTLGFTLEDKNIPDDSTNLRFLGLSEGPCSGKLADIDVGGMPLGEAIKELEKLEQNGEGVAFHIDPRSKWATSSIDYLATIGAPAAQTRGFKGLGTLIAVLDTGVGNGLDDVTELGIRLRNDLAYDFVNQIESAVDDFDQVIDGTGAGDGTIEGHGTPIAVLAAGSLSGVAPEAEILPVKTCDKTGKCLSSDVILGVCHALTEAQAEDTSLVINLSLGGDTPVGALEAVLDYALSTGVLVAAAAGNEGLDGSPIHYPAAFDLPGLVAVGALEAPSLSCVDYDDLDVGSQFRIGGNPLISSGVTTTLEEFFFLPDGSTTTGVATVDGQGQAGGMAQDLNSNNVNLNFGFSYPLDGITLSYGDYGGNVNLRVNDELKNVSGIEALDDVPTLGEPPVIGDPPVLIAVQPDIDPFKGPLPTGRLGLAGTINSFTLGGQELWIDDVCPIKRTAWQPADFSTRGDYLDISAPGKAIRSSSPTNIYSDYEGTSFSTPLVAGALALWREAKPTATPTEIETGLKDSAQPLPFTPQEVGTGLLDLSLDPQ
jgi:subtilisin